MYRHKLTDISDLTPADDVQNFDESDGQQALVCSLSLQVAKPATWANVRGPYWT